MTDPDLWSVYLHEWTDPLPTRIERLSHLHWHPLKIILARVRLLALLNVRFHHQPLRFRLQETITAQKIPDETLLYTVHQYP